MSGPAVTAAILFATVLLFVEPTVGSVSHANKFTARGYRGQSGTSGLLTLFSVATDLYSKLQYNDVDCQKKIICEFMKDPDMFDSGLSSVKTGVDIATSYLQSWGVPYVTEIRDAASLNANDNLTCEQRHKQCEDISLKDSYNKSVHKVNKVKKEINKPANTDTEATQPADIATTESSSDEEYEYEYYD